MLSTKGYKRKQFVYSEGDRAEEMYIIRSGEIRIFKNLKGKNITIGTAQQEQFFRRSRPPQE